MSVRVGSSSGVLLKVMEKLSKLRRIRDFDSVIHLILFLCVAALSVGFFLLAFGAKNIGLDLVPSTSTVVGDVKESRCGKDCRDEIAKVVADAVATIAAVPKVVVQKVAPTDNQKRTVFIPLSGSYTTAGNDWADIKSTDVWIDLKNEYSQGAYVDWEASIKNSSISGKTFVRLYDATNKIAVDGSELSSITTTSARVSSGRLNLWAGHNIYRVQIRSLAPYEATFEGGKIKIVY